MGCAASKAAPEARTYLDATDVALSMEQDAEMNKADALAEAVEMEKSSRVVGCRSGTGYHQKEKAQAIVHKALQLTQDFPHPMVLCKASEFVLEGRLRPHEELRDENKLTYLDIAADIVAFKEHNHIAFMSHQWLGFETPDPQGAHYDAICGAVRTISAACQLPLERVYLWVDFASMPQRNKGASRTTVLKSLPAYAALAHCMVVIAPPATHGNLGQPCSVASYRLRGWCRLELLAKICGSGRKDMWLVESADGAFTPINATDDEWLMEAIHVFDGQFSCCRFGTSAKCDREYLVLPVLGLYYEMLQMRDTNKDMAPFVAPFVETVEREKASLFPASFTFTHEHAGPVHRPGEKRVLFGGLIAEVERCHRQEVAARNGAACRIQARARGMSIRSLRHGPV